MTADPEVIQSTTTPPLRRFRRGRPSLGKPVVVFGRRVGDYVLRAKRASRLTVDNPWRPVGVHNGLRLALLLPIVLFCFSLYQNLSNMDVVDFHRDEARWINRAYFARDFLDPFSETWQDYYITQGQPPLGNYLMGIGLALQGRDLDTNRVWDFSYDEEWNILSGAAPDPADLNAGRRTNAVIGALVVVCVYTLASRLTNRVGGFAAGLLLSVHPLHLRLSSQALSDELLALLLMLAFLMAFRFARAPGIGSALLLGSLLGLGGAAKLSPLLLSLPLAAYGAMWILWTLYRKGRRGIVWDRGRYGWLLLAQPAIAYVVFVLANPYLWPNPIGRTLGLLNFRRQEMDGQSSAWPIAGVDGPLTALQRTGRRFDVDYSSTVRIQEWWGDTWNTVPSRLSLDGVLMCAGVVVLLALVVKRGMWSSTGLTAMLMAASSGAIIVGMGVDFYRYFLPLLIVLATCAGVAIGATWEMVGPQSSLRSRSTWISEYDHRRRPSPPTNSSDS